MIHRGAGRDATGGRSSGAPSSTFGIPPSASRRIPLPLTPTPQLLHVQRREDDGRLDNSSTEFLQIGSSRGPPRSAGPVHDYPGYPVQSLRQPVNPIRAASTVSHMPASAVRTAMPFYPTSFPGQEVANNRSSSRLANPVPWFTLGRNEPHLSPYHHGQLLDSMTRLSISPSPSSGYGVRATAVGSLTQAPGCQAQGASSKPAAAAATTTTTTSLSASPVPETPRVFRPMESKLARRAGERPAGLFPPQPQAWERMIAGFSPNYQGNIGLARNRSADIPAHLNCSLFILNLPPGITTRALLAAVRGAGRVYASHINAPEPERGHRTCAAKVTFFERAAAERLHSACAAAGGLRLPPAPVAVDVRDDDDDDDDEQRRRRQRQQRQPPGRRPPQHSPTVTAARVVWNRIRSAEVGGPRHQTRVLQISGPARLVNAGTLTAYFRTKLEFQVDEVLDAGRRGDGANNVVEYRFGSFRCQAEAARMALAREWGEFGVKVWFGPDPCDVQADAEGPAGLADYAVVARV